MGDIRDVVTIKPASIVAALEGFYQFKQEDDLTKPRPYPIIHPSPSFGLLMSSMRFKDYLAWGAVAGAAIPTGLIMGSPLRIPTVKVCLSIGVVGGFILALQNSYNRLAGFSENSSELRSYAFRPSTLVKVPVRKDPIPEDILQLAR
eukprot:Phypoly_transcript_22579.p1 GENE.Phypoly_transcript_22579~~Phypoly_transcript_22579.p1  ORF type:complete len:147 (+),score=15.69 Phypoly_transcript_22579:85-525(+)